MTYAAGGPKAGLHRRSWSEAQMEQSSRKIEQNSVECIFQICQV